MNARPCTTPLNTPRSAIEWLDQESSFRELIQRAAGLVRLQDTLNSSGLRFPVQALAVDGSTLIVATRSASQAALLRQQAPSLLASLREHGSQLGELRVRVRPDLQPRKAPRPGKRRTIPDGTLSQLGALAQQNSDSHLGQALERLIRHQRRIRRPEELS